MTRLETRRPRINETYVGSIQLMRGEHMRTCVLAHTETLPANKITKKIREKHRWPSETKKGKNIRTVPMRTCVHVHTLKEITALRVIRGRSLETGKL